MPGKRLDKPIPDWLRDAATKAGTPSYALLQGYPFTGFARVDAQADDPLILPPAEISTRADGSLDWTQFWDLRVFGTNGECHAWRVGARWCERYFAFDGDAAEREYVLYGSRAAFSGDWTRCSEDRGVEVWIPFPVTVEQLPVRMRMKLRIETEWDTGLAGIVDAAIAQLVIG